jgi:hypothetical protein
MPQREDRLLEGAFDTHAHAYPEFTLGMPPRVTNLEWARLASAAGMRGFVMKSHIFPTVTLAQTLSTMSPGLEIAGGVALNPPVGGLNPLTVELVAQTGGRVIWLPTWAARQEPGKPNIFRDRMKPWIRVLEEHPQAAPDIGIFSEDGSLRPQMAMILDIAQRYDLVLATGHLPIQSSLVLSEECQTRGIRLLLTHPLSGSVGADLNQQRTIASRGGMIEHVFIGCMPMHQKMDPRRIVEAITAVGAEHCVLGSDAVEAWNPPAPEVLRMFIATLLALGVDQGAVHAMTHENPVSLFDLDARPLTVTGAQPDDSGNLE